MRGSVLLAVLNARAAEAAAATEAKKDEEEDEEEVAEAAAATEAKKDEEEDEEEEEAFEVTTVDLDSSLDSTVATSVQEEAEEEEEEVEVEEAEEEDEVSPTLLYERGRGALCERALHRARAGAATAVVAAAASAADSCGKRFVDSEPVVRPRRNRSRSTRRRHRPTEAVPERRC